MQITTQYALPSSLTVQSDAVVMNNEVFAWNDVANWL